MKRMKLSITHDDVKNTSYFKSLSRTQQEVIKSWNNIKVINHGFELAQWKTFEELEKQHNFNQHNLEIIKELIKLKK